MAEFYEDSPSKITSLERQLLAGVPNFPHVNALLKRLRQEVLSDPVKHATARAIIKLGTSSEPGAVYFTLFKRRTLTVRFRSKKNNLDIDAALSPYYGNVLPGLAELRDVAIDEALEAYWLEFFRKDSSTYRVYVVAAMSIAAAIQELR